MVALTRRSDKQVEVWAEAIVTLTRRVDIGRGLGNDMVALTRRSDKQVEVWAEAIVTLTTIVGSVVGREW